MSRRRRRQPGNPPRTLHASPRSPIRDWRAILAGAAIAAAALAVYWQVAGYGFINFDDPKYVSRNPWIAQGLTLDSLRWALTSTELANWIPLTYVSLLFDSWLHGPGPGGFHLTNVLLHCANVLLLYAFVLRRTGETLAAAACALLFALHPIHVESVAWITERKDVLSTFFFLASLHCYCELAAGRRGFLPHLPALAAMALGLMAKPMLVSLPLVLLLLDFWPLGRLPAPGLPFRQAWPELRPLLLEKIPYALLAAGFAAATLLVQARGGSVSGLAALPLGLRAANAAVSAVRYLGLLVFPRDLALLYPFPDAVPAWRTVAALALLAGLTALAWRLRRRLPYLLFGWLWFLCTLAPVSGLVQVGAQAMADRYAYIPFQGLYLALAMGSLDLARRLPAAAARSALLAFWLSAGAVLAWLAQAQAATWRDSVTVFGRAVAVTEGNYIAHTNLGEALSQERGDAAGAMEHFRAALAIHPGHATALNNLGAMLLNAGRPDEALPYLEKAAALQPDYATAYYNLGYCHALRGDWAGAETFYEKALAISPRYQKALRGLERARAELAGAR